MQGFIGAILVQEASFTGPTVAVESFFVPTAVRSALAVGAKKMGDRTVYTRNTLVAVPTVAVI